VTHKAKIIAHKLHTNRKKEIRFVPQCTHTNAITKSGRTQQREEEAGRMRRRTRTKYLASKPLNWLQLTLNRREEGKLGRTRLKAQQSS
jgi:hypothetical protein